MFAKNILMVLAVAVGLVFAAAFTVQAYDSGETTFAPLFYSGKIVGIDPAYRTLTVQADSKDEAYFTVSDNASIMMCDRDASFKDLKIGETVELMYFTESLGGTRYVKDLKTEMKC